jgi:hypothetical protein
MASKFAHACDSEETDLRTRAQIARKACKNSGQTLARVSITNGLRDGIITLYQLLLASLNSIARVQLKA